MEELRSVYFSAIILMVVISGDDTEQKRGKQKLHTFWLVNLLENHHYASRNFSGRVILRILGRVASASNRNESQESS
jgi:hypothetical protein